MKPPIGWERMEAAWWPMIADALARPWPREAVLMDLRFWRDQEMQGRCSRPGRPALAARWGWGDKAARTVIARGGWEDPRWLEEGGVQPGSSRGPAGVQPGSSDDTGERQESAEKVQPGSSRGPAGVQPGSPRAYSQDTITIHDTQQGGAAPAADAAPPAAGAAASEVTDECETDPPPSVLPLPVGAEGQTEPAKNGEHGGIPDSDADLLRLWGALCDAIGSRANITGGNRRGILSARVRELGAPGILRIVEWVRTSQSFDATNLRKRRDPDTLIRPSNAFRYLEMADREGQRVNGVDAMKAWGIVCEMISRFPIPPRATWHPNEEIRKAMDAGLEAVGGSNAVKLREKRAEEWMRARFAQAYEGVHRA